MNNNFFYNAYIYFNKLKNRLMDKDDIDKQKNIVGIYDKSNKIWYNGWAIVSTQYENYKKSKDLLMYALNIEKDMPGVNINEKALIKSILINSKFYIHERKLQLNVILSVIAYLLKAIKWTRLTEGDLDYYVMVTT
jgi:hypothetical protein